MDKTVGILIPVAKPKIKEISLSPRVNDLNNKILGFLWNGKPNGDILLHRIEEQLSKRYGLADTRYGEGGGFGEAADDNEVKKMAAVDTVVIAVSD